MKKIVLITGATSGIGMSTARLFAKNDYNIIITGRRKERLEEFANELRSTTEVLTLTFDVRSNEEVVANIKSIPEEWQKIDVLVNNAGLARGLSDIQNGVIDDWETMIDTNVKGLLYMTKAVTPLMIAHGNGHIINIGSTAGKEVYFKGNVYAATKHAVNALTKSMRIDLLSEGIKVTGVHPGHVLTEFAKVRFDGDEEKAGATYRGFTPLSPDDVAEVIFFAASRPANVNIDDVVMMCTAQGSVNHIKRSSKS